MTLTNLVSLRFITMLVYELKEDPHWIDLKTLTAQFDPQDTKDARRCVIREIDMNLLGEGDAARLNEMIDAFCAQEEFFLRLLESKKFRRYSKDDQSFRDFRNAIVQGRIAIEMRHGLQARHWKLALDCACQTTRGYWALVLMRIRSRLSRSRTFYANLNEAEKKYVNRLTFNDDDRFFDMLDGKTPPPAETVKGDMTKGESATVKNPKALCAKIRSVIRAVQGKFPHMQSRRVCWFDVDCYKVKKLFNGDQIVSLTSLVPGKRIPVTVHGVGRIANTIRLVRSATGLALHVAQPVKRKSLKGIPKPAEGSKLRCVAADMGFTEVFTDDEGNQYGCNLGIVLKKQAKWLCRKLAQRNKFEAMARTTTDPHKRENILRFNLGTKRFNKQLERFKIHLSNIVNRAINEMLKNNPADVYLVERLCSRFRFPRYYSAEARNKLSVWIRGIIHDRLEFKAFENNVRLFYVPAPYTSQRCPVCGNVDAKNRRGDRFQCLFCGHTDQADRNGARNILMAPHHGIFTEYLSKYEIKSKYQNEHKKFAELMEAQNLINCYGMD